MPCIGFSMEMPLFSCYNVFGNKLLQESPIGVVCFNIEIKEYLCSFQIILVNQTNMIKNSC